MLFDTDNIEQAMFKPPVLANHGWQRAMYRANGEQSTFGKVLSTGLPVVAGAAGMMLGGPMGAAMASKVAGAGVKGLNNLARNSAEGTDTYDMIDVTKSHAQANLGAAAGQLSGAAMAMGGPAAMMRMGFNAKQASRAAAGMPDMLQGGAESFGGIFMGGNPFGSSALPYNDFDGR